MRGLGFWPSSILEEVVALGQLRSLQCTDVADTRAFTDVELFLHSAPVAFPMLFGPSVLRPTTRDFQ